MNEYVKILIKLANKSLKYNDIPVGAIVLKDNEIVGKGYNNRYRAKKVTGHAEINAILAAEKKLNDHRLNGCVLISTLMPCPMCREVIKESRIDKVYYILSRPDSENLKIKGYEKLDNIELELVKKYKEDFLNFFKKMR